MIAKRGVKTAIGVVAVADRCCLAYWLQALPR